MAGKIDVAEFDVAIVGGGPAGLSAAVVLGRARRHVVLFDHGRPRNYAAKAVHCFLGLNGIAPSSLRDCGRREAESYGVSLVNAEVIRATHVDKARSGQARFEVETNKRVFRARALLLATGVVDKLPEIPGLKELYGSTVHHCPYCDGWEHRDQHIVALGDRKSAVKLALTLVQWSSHITACSNGEDLAEQDLALLATKGIAWREHKIARLDGSKGRLSAIIFEDERSLPCEAIFFGSEQGQRSSLPSMLNCNSNDEGLVLISLICSRRLIEPLNDRQEDWALVWRS
jgi:thioredoxin reductase